MNFDFSKPWLKRAGTVHVATFEKDILITKEMLKLLVEVAEDKGKKN